MKKIIALFLVVLLVLPVIALAADQLPRLKFVEDYHIGFINETNSFMLTVKNPNSFSSSYTLELRDETGRVWGTKKLNPGTEQITFRPELDETFEGGAKLSVWAGDTQVSTTELVTAVTDRHRKVIQSGDTQEPYMSITIDCAYHAAHTDMILEILEEYNVKATFFMTGEFIENFPEEAAKIVAAGHEVGSHSYSHPHMLEKSVNSAFYQISRSVELIRENLGVVPRLFRPPFGEFNVTISAPARAEGMEVCLWTIDSHDWDEEYTQEQVIKRVKKNVGPGTIILFHLDGYYTPQVLREVLPYYQNELGLTQITVSELMEISGRELPASPYITEEEPVAAEEEFAEEPIADVLPEAE